MVRTHHRRSLPMARFFAFVAPSTAVVLASVTFLVDPIWSQVAAVVGAVAAAVLGGLVIQLQRRLRTDVAAVRASQAAAYSALHAQYSDEHRQFTVHIIGLLDAAEERLTVQRHRLDDLHARLGAAERHPHSGSRELMPMAADQQWEELWPDLSELPTVVELLSWEERSRHGLLPEDIDLLPEAADGDGVQSA